MLANTMSSEPTRTDCVCRKLYGFVDGEPIYRYKTVQWHDVLNAQLQEYKDWLRSKEVKNEARKN